MAKRSTSSIEQNEVRKGGRDGSTMGTLMFIAMTSLLGHTEEVSCYILHRR